jgi:hypothetical protein
MENIAFNNTGAIYLDAVGADGALKVAANCHFLCDDVTQYLCAFSDHDIRGAYLTFDATKNSQTPMAITFPKIESGFWIFPCVDATTRSLCD